MSSRPGSLYLTADNGIPSGNPCASSTRKKEQDTKDLVDLSMQATRGSDDNTRDPEPKDETDVISPKQLQLWQQFTRQCPKNWPPCWQAETWRKLDLAYIEVQRMGPLTDGFW